MNIEGRDRHNSKDQLSESTRLVVEGGFSGGRGLHGDAYTPWLVLSITLHDEPGIFKPLEHYEEYIRRTSSTPQEIDYMMQLSKPEAILALDELIDQLNQDIDRIKREKDEGKLDEFVKKAKTLIFRKYV